MAFFEFPHTRTYDSDLGWIIQNISGYNDAINALNKWVSETTPRLDDLETFKAALESGTLPEGVQRGIETWLSQNAATIITALIKNVWFGLSDSGYFVAYIPESWSDIIFKTTGLDFESELVPEYGHLVLQYNY